MRVDCGARFRDHARARLGIDGGEVFGAKISHEGLPGGMPREYHLSARSLSPFVTPPRPVDHASAVQSPPDQDWLQRQPRPVIEPAVGDGWKVDALQDLLDA